MNYGPDNEQLILCLRVGRLAGLTLARTTDVFYRWTPRLRLQVRRLGPTNTIVRSSSRHVNTVVAQQRSAMMCKKVQGKLDEGTQLQRK